MGLRELFARTEPPPMTDSERHFQLERHLSAFPISNADIWRAIGVTFGDYKKDKRYVNYWQYWRRIPQDIVERVSEQIRELPSSSMRAYDVLRAAGAVFKEPDPFLAHVAFNYDRKLAESPEDRWNEAMQEMQEGKRRSASSGDDEFVSFERLVEQDLRRAGFGETVLFDRQSQTEVPGWGLGGGPKIEHDMSSVIFNSHTLPYLADSEIIRAGYLGAGYGRLVPGIRGVCEVVQVSDREPVTK